jgi:ABC-type molybdate transport system substrate-binding protein
MKSLFLSVAVVALALGSAGAHAQGEITLLSPNPIKETVDKLVADFEAKSGVKVKITYGSGVGTRKTVAEGKALDVTLLFAPFDDALKTGNVVQQRYCRRKTSLGNRGEEGCA